MSIGANETEIRYWTDYANPRDGICFRKEDAHMLVHEHYELERIKAENDKLRVLASDLWLDMHNAYVPKELEEYADRMRELGIEA